MCLSKMFQMQARSGPRGGDSIAHTNTSEEQWTIDECKGKPSSVLSTADSIDWWVMVGADEDRQMRRKKVKNRKRKAEKQGEILHQ